MGSSHQCWPADGRTTHSLNPAWKRVRHLPDKMAKCVVVWKKRKLQEKMWLIIPFLFFKCTLIIYIDWWKKLSWRKHNQLMVVMVTSVWWDSHIVSNCSKYVSVFFIKNNGSNSSNKDWEAMYSKERDRSSFPRPIGLPQEQQREQPRGLENILNSSTEALSNTWRYPLGWPGIVYLL